MNKKSIFQLLVLITIGILVIAGCEETVWPEVNKVNKADFLGTWTAPDYRTKITYIRTQDTQTMDFMARDTTVTDSVIMKFELGVARSSGQMVEDSVKVTTILTKNKVAQTPVVKSGYYTIGETGGNDYEGPAVYLNLWEKKTTVHSGFANPLAEPYVTYTVFKKSSGEMELSWTLFNQTAQSSTRYNVVLKK